MRKRIKKIPKDAEKLISALPFGWSKTIAKRTDFAASHVVNVIHSGNKNHVIWNEAAKLALETKKQKEETEQILKEL